MKKAGLWLLLGGVAAAAPPALPDAYPLHALVHARVYVTPERAVDDATLIVRDGKVVSVERSGPVPPGARVWECRGKVVHAGFVEPFLGETEASGASAEPKPQISGQGDTVDHELKSGGGAQPQVTDPHPPFSAQRVLSSLGLAAERRQALLKQGIVAVQLVPQHGVFKGHGAVFSLRAQSPLLKAQSSQVIGPRTASALGHDDAYPLSFMGNLALIRQAFREADWSGSQQPSALPAVSSGASLNPSQAQSGWAALRQARLSGLPIFYEGGSLLEGLNLKRTLREVPNLRLIYVATSEAAARPEWLTDPSVITVDFPQLPKPAAQRHDLSFEQLASWRHGPALAARLRAPHALSIHRLENWDDYSSRLEQLRQGGASPAQLLEALTRRPAQWLGVAGELGTLEPGKWAHLVVRSGEPFTKAGKVEQVWFGSGPERLPVPETAPEDSEEDKPASLVPTKLPAYPSWKGPGSVLIRGATVWTQSAQGVLSDCDVLIRRGKIAAVAKGLSAPDLTLVVDGRGKHLIPGLIDAHSHTAVVGDVNEGTLNVSAGVRIQDVLNPLDPNILHQLAGGVTCAHVLHGSANAIGGQTVTCKWRWGGDADDLLLEGALPGIKFALGENPKQSNWGDQYTKRYPQSRQGVAALIRQRFMEAKKYRQLPNPQPDAALEALVEVLDGKRLVHCHSYRQDEILMLLRVAEEMGFRVATLQHALEAYKVAREVAAHGAGVSTFSDWWAYKMEVIDAIPYNAALTTRHGVVTSFNSDSDELARRLLGEAAKAVRYGGLSETEALALLTINPARQLRIEARMGSLEVGKDGDCSLWSDSPFEPQSHCLATWVEGQPVFELQDYRARMAERQALRQRWLEEAFPK